MKPSKPQVSMGSNEQALEEFVNHVKKNASDSWLGIFINVEQGSLYIKGTTWKFPANDFPEAVAMITRDLADKFLMAISKEKGPAFSSKDYENLQVMLSKRREQMEEVSKETEESGESPATEVFGVYNEYEEEDGSEEMGIGQ